MLPLYDPDRRWVDRAACRKLDSEPFFAPGGQPNRPPQKQAQAAWDEAKEACSHCPVLEECRRDTLGEEYGVFGGLDEHQRYLIRRALSRHKRWKRWPEARQLAWGEHLAKLRLRGLSFSEIQRLTGFTSTVVTDLIDGWKKSLPEDAPAPRKSLASAKRPSFPEAKGSRHGWVRNGLLIADGWYAGHTADGAWVCMQIFSGRGNVKKWFPPEDVKFYTKQRRWVVPYRGRPDAADVQEGANVA
ncbi:WhiB family transcriptional regulator [Streptomyces cinereoruber]|uniref:WhiB family transcriptional regulator n=1 Tax=Streptomyces cinereoruber TaxID=67260 RepID=UPI003C30C6DB